MSSETTPPTASQKSAENTAEKSATIQDVPDSSRRDIILYAFGNVENAIANQFFNVLNQIMIVAIMVNPLLLGLLSGIRLVWDSFMDPLMAYITDNTRSRWGRRRPYILVGGISRVVLLLIIVAFFPTGARLLSNAVMEAQKNINEGVKHISEAKRLSLIALEEYKTVDAKGKAKLIESWESYLKPIGKKDSTMDTTIATITSALPPVRQTLQEREEHVQGLLTRLEVLKQEKTPTETTARDIINVSGMIETSKERVQTTQKLFERAEEAMRDAFVVKTVCQHALSTYAPQNYPEKLSREEAQARVNLHFSALKVVPPADVFHFVLPPPPSPGVKSGLVDNIKEGFRAFYDPRNFDQRGLILYVLIAMLIFTTLTTLHSVPYYAMGMEIAPSYDGRTRVVTYRSVMDKTAGLVAPWVPVFCFSSLFLHATEGLIWVAVFACIIGIPSTTIMCWFVRSKTQVSAVKKKKHAGLLHSMWQIGKDFNFLKIFFLYAFIGLVNGLFVQFGFFLNVYWVMGSALAGSKLMAWVSMLAWVLGLLALPAVNWGCQRFQKHRIMQFAILWLALGTGLQWWAVNPEYPWLQLILPFFFSIGIISVYTVLPSLMADVTDVDELNYGERREGMFGAVMAFLTKLIASITPVAAGAILVASGFDSALEYQQTESTILNMRLMYSFVPAGLLLFTFFILFNYPLTRERVMKVKAEIAKRRAVEAA